MNDLDDETFQKIRQDEGDAEKYVVYAMRVFKGSQDFQTFTIDHKFDASKLTAITETWGSEEAIKGFMYDGKEIESEGCNSGNHKLDIAWIDD